MTQIPSSNSGETSETDHLLTRIQQLLSCSDLHNRSSELQKMIDEAQVCLKTTASIRKILGPLLAQLRMAQQSLHTNPISWVEIGSGNVSLGPRPKEKMVARMRWYGVTHVLTLQAKSEKAATIGKLVKQNGMQWFWFPMESADPPDSARRQELLSLFEQLEIALANGAGVYIHCAAGIHRTGMIGFGLLRYLGYSQDEAERLLQRLREETAQGVGAERKAWATSLFV